MVLSARRREPYRDVVVTAPVTVPYRRYSNETAHWWIAAALREVCTVTGLAPADLDGISLASFTLFPDPAVALVQHLGLSPRYVDGVAMGGASACVALRRAARAVEAGDASLVVCVAGDTNRVDGFRVLLNGFSRFAQDAVNVYGFGGPNAVFALITDNYMRATGATREDFGKICVAQRHNALGFPHALMKKPLDMEDYLAARAVADPIVLYDCVMPCAGAEAFVVTTADVADDLGLPSARLTATIERHNAFSDDPIQDRGGWRLDIGELYAMGGIAPEGIDLVETYDDYPVIVMLQLEDLGFCGHGEGAEFVRAHELTAEGSFPHNTSGGQLSVGQAGAAGGHLGLVEAVRQVTGRAIGREVANARRALVSGFGMVNFDRGVCTSAAILEAR